MNRSFLRRLEVFEPAAGMLGSGAIEIESLNAYTTLAVFGVGIVAGGLGTYYFREKQVITHLQKTLKGTKDAFGVKD